MKPAKKFSRKTRHFLTHLAFVSKVYLERNAAKEDVFDALHKLRHSAVKSGMSHSDINRLKRKLSDYMHWESKFSKFFKAEDPELNQLKEKLAHYEAELDNERNEKIRLLEERDAKIKELNDSIGSLKNHARFLLSERAKRHQRLIALEKKINEKVDVHNYLHSN